MENNFIAIHEFHPKCWAISFRFIAVLIKIADKAIKRFSIYEAAIKIDAKYIKKHNNEFHFTWYTMEIYKK